jgi:hypothetical protein
LSVVGSHNFGPALVKEMLWTVLTGAIVFASVCLAQHTHYLWGPTWGYRINPKWNKNRPGHPKGFIIALETTLFANTVPEKVSPRLAIWPGMDATKGLVQPVVVSSSEKNFVGR